MFPPLFSRTRFAFEWGNPVCRPSIFTPPEWSPLHGDRAGASKTADGESTTDLVLRCSDAIESLAIRRHPSGAFPPVPMTGQYLIATCGRGHVWGRLRSTSPSPRLKRVTFRFGRQTTQWTTMVLKIVKSENSQLITIHSPATFQIPLVNTVHQE